MTPKLSVHALFLFIFGFILAACSAPVEPAAQSADIETTRPTSTIVATSTAELPAPIPLSTPTAVPFITPTPFQPTPIPSPTKISRPTEVAEGRSTGAMISDNGRFIAFLSTGEWAANARGQELAVFLRDVESGTIELISVAQDGDSPQYPIYAVNMSDNGKVFAYFSFDSNIVAEDTVMCGEGEAAISCEDLFIYDRDTGTTEMLALGREQGLGADYTMGISADGRYIALGHDNNLLLYDHLTKQSQYVLTTIDGQPLNSAPFAPSLSADGRFIAFVSYASNLVADDRNEEADVFVLDRETDQIERVSVATDGSEADGESGAMPTHESVNGATDISADGRFITFPSNATNLNDQPSVMCDDYRGFTRPCYNVYLHDRATGETILISQGGDSDSLAPTLSADGQIIAFSSTATNLTADNLPACDPPGTINCSHIYRFDRQTGELILVTGAANSGAWDAQISGNGRYITFTSEATNLSPDDTNNSSDIVRYDHEAGKIERISTQPGS